MKIHRHHEYALLTVDFLEQFWHFKVLTVPPVFLLKHAHRTLVHLQSKEFNLSYSPLPNLFNLLIIMKWFERGDIIEYIWVLYQGWGVISDHHVVPGGSCTRNQVWYVDQYEKYVNAKTCKDLCLYANCHLGTWVFKCERRPADWVNALPQLWHL